MSMVYVGMSGGIDSSAAAFLLKKEGFDVTGVTFTAFQEEGYKKCCSIEEITSAGIVCEFLKIPHKIIDVRDIFEAKIIRYFIKSYESGITPNPCVLCNRYIKFGALLEYSISEGADYFATGHYARIKKGKDNLIQAGIDSEKDQSYFISYIEKEKLPFILLPLGYYKKEDIRQIIKEASLPINPHKSESQDICFIKDDYRDFLLMKGIKENIGDFVYKGKIAGKHRGIPFYSLGQRRGLNVAVGKRIFLREFDVAANRIVLGDKPMAKEFTVSSLNIFTKDFQNGEYSIKVRYKSSFIQGLVKIESDKAIVMLNTPQEIVTPGQFAVFYREGLVYASGVIDSTNLIPSCIQCEC